MAVALEDFRGADEGVSEGGKGEEGEEEGLHQYYIDDGFGGPGFGLVT